MIVLIKNTQRLRRGCVQDKTFKSVLEPLAHIAGV